MLKDINNHIKLINGSIEWANQYEKNTFPYEIFQEYRRRLKRIHRALEENCSAAAYGESQVGKSYLMSSLLSSPNSPFIIKNRGKEYSFIDEINPSGGNNSKVESTGVVTRFTLQPQPNVVKDYVKIQNLSIVDIILLIADSYQNDVKPNTDHVLQQNDINLAIDSLSVYWSDKMQKQKYLTSDDIFEIRDYVNDELNNVHVIKSNFFKVISQHIECITVDHWADVFSLLWNRNEQLSHLFSVLIDEYKKMDFCTEIYVPFECVRRDYGTLLDIKWLDTVCGVNCDMGNYELYTTVYDANGNTLSTGFPKGSLSAITAEITFPLSPSLADDRQFLTKIDLLDFPGARTRKKYKEEELGADDVLPEILRRSKVGYLFKKYSNSLRISSVLFCHHNDQRTVDVCQTIDDWIRPIIGKTPEERAVFTQDTDGISPLFFVATKFNIDLKKNKIDVSGHSLDKHWERFDTVLPEMMTGFDWFENWSKSSLGSIPFRSIYPLRDFWWSKENGLFVGYNDGETKSQEKDYAFFSDYPNYFKDLSRSFAENNFVKKHFSNPSDTWNEVATVNNDGSKAIIRDLNKIAPSLEEARREKYLKELKQIKTDMYNTLSVYFEPDDIEERNAKVKKIASDIRMSLFLSVGEKPEVFGQIIDTLMVPVGELRDIAYDIIVCRTKTPTDFSLGNFIRKLTDINSNDSRQTVIEKLCDFFGCEQDKLEDELKNRGWSIADVVSNEAETLTTVADVVTKDIIDYWVNYINDKAKKLETILPHSESVVFMLSALMTKMGVKKIISEKIGTYCNVFSTNEQPNAIADFTSLTLNNFVSSVGRCYLTDDEVANIKKKAEKCSVKVDLNSSAWNETRKPQPLMNTLCAFDAASDINSVAKDDLMKLPLWENFQRWANLVTIGLLYASEISQIDPIANGKIKELIDKCSNLYN